MVKIHVSEFRQAMHQEHIKNAMQIFFASFDYIVSSNASYVYKGDGSGGFRPELSVQDGTIILTLPKNFDRDLLMLQLAEAFPMGLSQMQIKGDVLHIRATSEEFAHYLMDNIGVRKTAVISENKEGQILAGKLDYQKKKASGFATAGGNAHHPYNADGSARAEGEHEFGYVINEDAVLIPVGSTLANKNKNIFLIRPGGTSDEKKPIAYMEFQDGSIKYYSFKEFAQAYNESANSANRVKFDRSSVDLYLRYCQREIQKSLHGLGINDLLVHISKKPGSLGRIVLKPSIDRYDYSLGSKKMANPACVKLMQELLGENHFNLVDKQSYQGKTQKTKIDQIVIRQCIEISEDINPAKFCAILYGKLNNDKAKLYSTDESLHSTAEQQDVVQHDDAGVARKHSTDESVHSSTAQQDEVLHDDAGVVREHSADRSSVHSTAEQQDDASVAREHSTDESVHSTAAQQDEVQREHAGDERKYSAHSIAEQQAYDDLRNTLITQINKYLEWCKNKDSNDGRGYQLGFLSKVRHTSSGEKRATDLQEIVKSAETTDDLILMLQAHLGKKSSVHNHSLDTYLLEGLNENHNELFGIAGEKNELKTMADRSKLHKQICDFKVAGQERILEAAQKFCIFKKQVTTNNDSAEFYTSNENDDNKFN